MTVSMSDVPEAQREFVESGRKAAEQQLIFSFGEKIFFWVNPSRATLRPFQDPESYNGGKPLPFAVPLRHPALCKIKCVCEERSKEP
jgi:hypothetical protein